MAFFEKFGETFSSAVEDISETIAGAGKDMGQKAKDFSEIAKVAKDIRIKENRVQKMYAQLGTKYYDMHKNDAENEYEEIASITSALEEIEQLKKDLPVYMIPNVLKPIEEFPLSKNGKIDRKRLMEEM